MFCLRQNNIKLFEFFASKTNNFGGFDSDNRNYLESAILFCPEAVSILLENGASPNEKTVSDSPLMLALSVKSPVYKLLLDAGADVNFKNEHGMTAFKVAFNHFQNALFDLLDAGAKIDTIFMNTSWNQNHVFNKSQEIVKTWQEKQTLRTSSTPTKIKTL